MKAIIATTVMGILMMFASFLMKGRKSNVVALATVLMSLLVGINVWEMLTLPSEGLFLFNNMLHLDKYSVGFSALMTICTLLYLLLSGKNIARVGSFVAEYFALIFFILCGLYVLSSYNTLLMLFLGIEILSIPQYILAGSDKRNLKSSEASLKYFLMGAFSTGILLMGIALLYGASGTFTITDFEFLSTGSLNPMALGGVLMLIVALGFKVSAAPMHLWTPDVYDGSPTPFTSYMSTVLKAAAFMAFLRLFHNTGIAAISDHWMLVLSIITAATLFVGNITAIFQQSVKRMLAYSSIAQAGFMLFAVLSASSAVAFSTANKGLLLYAVAYSIATIGLFAVLMKLKDYTYDGFNGLAKKEPLLAAVSTIFIFSLAGIPLTGGFIAKYYVLYALIEQGGMLWLVIFALCMAAISSYYYFRVIMAMYFKKGEALLHEPIVTVDKVMLTLTAALVILVGIVPEVVLWWGRS